MKVAARGFRRVFFVLFSLGVGVNAHAAAKDLTGRFGFGVANIGLTAMPPSLSIDWHSSQASAFEFDLGMDTSSTNNLLLLGTRYFRNVFIEENAFFAAELGGGLLSQQINGASQSGYFLEVGGGGKFFFAGLPNLGLGFVASLGLRSTGGVRFMTQGLFSAHYYF